MRSHVLWNTPTAMVATTARAEGRTGGGERGGVRGARRQTARTERESLAERGHGPDVRRVGRVPPRERPRQGTHEVVDVVDRHGVVAFLESPVSPPSDPQGAEGRGGAER